jgi:hypothetical protein
MRLSCIPAHSVAQQAYKEIPMITLADGRTFPEDNGEVVSWSIALYLTAAEADAGYPKARAVIQALRSTRPAQLAQERAAFLKASFDRAFGHHATIVLQLIEQTA